MGPLQFEVASYRMEHEFGAPISLRSVPWTEARRVSEEGAQRLENTRGTQIARDARGQAFALFEGGHRRQDAEKLLGQASRA